MVSSAVTLVVFDCDGTLVDSAHNVIACMQKAFQEAGLPVPSDQSIRRTIGLNPDVAVRSLAARPLSFEQLDRIVTTYKTSFFHRRLQIDHHEPLFDGVRSVLDALYARDIAMAVATGKSLRGLHAVIEQHGLQKYFSSLQTPDHNPGKPHPQMLDKAMSEVDGRRERTFMVGDTTFDMMLARNAGCRAVGVSWGYHDASELKETGAEWIIDHFDELLDIVEAP